MQGAISLDFFSTYIRALLFSSFLLTCQVEAVAVPKVLGAALMTNSQKLDMDYSQRIGPWPQIYNLLAVSCAAQTFSRGLVVVGVHIQVQMSEASFRSRSAGWSLVLEAGKAA